MSEIHPTAVIDPKATIGKNVKIGPYCVIKGNVTLEDGVELIAHVYIEGNTTIGAETKIWPFASLGTQTQDLKYRGETTYVCIGKQCKIREYVTINASSNEGSTVKVGDNCALMIGCHIAHDCEIGNHVIMSNNATIAGHVTVGDYANVGGLVGVHQFCRIGAYAMVGGMSGVAYDIPPYSIATGNPTKVGGLNLVGLKRRGVSFSVRKALSHAYRLFYHSGLRVEEAIAKIEEEVEMLPEVSHLISFFQTSSRGVTPHGRSNQLQELEKDLSDESE